MSYACNLARFKRIQYTTRLRGVVQFSHDKALAVMNSKARLKRPLVVAQAREKLEPATVTARARWVELLDGFLKADRAVISR